MTKNEKRDTDVQKSNPACAIIRVLICDNILGFFFHPPDMPSNRTRKPWSFRQAEPLHTISQQRYDSEWHEGYV